MPGKYSHSVVLAQHTSRGLITLPDDQYTAFVNSSPLLTTKAPSQGPVPVRPGIGARSTSTKTNASERSAAHNSTRQHSASNQISAGAYRHQYGKENLAVRPQRVFLDSEEEDNHESIDYDSPTEASRQRNAVSLAKSASTHLNQTRLPQRTTIQTHQQATQNGIPSQSPQSSMRVEQRKLPLSRPSRVAEVRPSTELVSQTLVDGSGVAAAQRSVPTALSHNADVSTQKSMATPQLSRSSTKMTHHEHSTATPFSVLEGSSTPAITDERRQRPGIEEADSSQSTRTVKPTMTRMPSEVDFDDFCDNVDSSETYFKDLPEPDESRKIRLKNMNAYNKVEPASDSLSKKETSVSTQNVPARPKGNLGLQPLPRNHLPDRMSSYGSLSSSSDFGIPSVQQVAPSRQKIATAAARAESQISIQQALQLEATASQKQGTKSTIHNGSQPPTTTPKKPTPPSSIFVALSKPPPQSRSHTPENGTSSLPAIPDSPFRRRFEHYMLESSSSQSSALTQLYGATDMDEEAGGRDASPAPVIARHPVVSPGGAIMSATQGQRLQHQRQHSSNSGKGASAEGQESRKGGIFSSLRLRGKKR